MFSSNKINMFRYMFLRNLSLEEPVAMYIIHIVMWKQILSMRSIFTHVYATLGSSLQVVYSQIFNNAIYMCSKWNANLCNSRFIPKGVHLFNNGRVPVITKWISSHLNDLNKWMKFELHFSFFNFPLYGGKNGIIRLLHMIII